MFTKTKLIAKKFIRSLIILSSMIIALGIIIPLMIVEQEEIVELYEHQYKALELASELRHCSDEMSRFCYMYVITGEPEYERFFELTFKIRKGEIEKPEGYSRVYLDRMADFSPVPASSPDKNFESQLHCFCYTAEERRVLLEVFKESEKLANLEKSVFSSVKKLIENRSGRRSSYLRERRYAHKLFFRKDYVARKDHILSLIKEFHELVKKRAAHEFKSKEKRQSLLLYLAFFTLVVSAVFFWVLSYHFKRRVLVPINILQDGAQRIEDGDTFYQIPEPPISNEIGELIAHFNKMVVKINQSSIKLAEVNRTQTLALKTGKIGIWSAVYDGTGWESSWDKTTADILGFKEEDEPDLAKVLELVAPEDRKSVTQSLYSSLHENGSYDIEHRVYNPISDSTRTIVLKGAVSAVGNAEKWRIDGVIVDVTDKRKIEQELYRKSNFLQALLDNSSAIIYVKDLEGRYILGNKAWQKLVGVDDPASALKTDFDIFPKEAAEAFIANDELALQLGRQVKKLEKQMSVDGRTLSYISLKFPIKDASGKVNFIGGISTDITALVEARRKAEEATAAKSSFLANMSHEIRTPMHTALGMCKLALETDLADKQRNYIQKAYNSAESLLGIINSILDFSKIEAGMMELEHTEFSLPAICDEVKEVVALKAEAKGLTLAFTIGPDVPKVVVGDPLRLKQVLINLLHNGIKFTEEGDVSLAVNCMKSDDSKALLRFTIKDTGIGFTNEKSIEIFSPFSQADSSTTRTYGGTGLGLSIAREIVALMGGSLQVESEEGRGTCFFFSTHFKVIAGGRAETLVNRHQEVHELNLQNIKILSVEDNEINQELIVEVLKSAHAVVRTAANGQEAVEVLRKWVPDIVLMDCQMPVMDGFEATEKIREFMSYKQLPIIALTANALEPDKDKALSCGMNDYVSKPVDAQGLFRKIVTWTNKETKKFFNLTNKMPLNTRIGLITCNNNQDLYHKIVRKFYNDYKNFDQMFRVAQLQEASAPMRCAHSLKGLAKSIGAENVSSLAEELEERCRRNEEKDVDELLNLIVHAVRVLKTEFKIFGGEDDNSDPDYAVDHQQVIGLFVLLKEKLESYDSEAGEIVGQLEKLTRNSRFSTIFDSLFQDVYNYNYTAALHKINELITDRILYALEG